MIRIYALKQKVDKGMGTSVIVPAFASLSNEDTTDIKLVSLARNPDHCYYSVDDFQAHNFHSPPMKSEADCDAYFARVKADVEKVVAEAGAPVGVDSAKEIPQPPSEGGWTLLFERK